MITAQEARDIVTKSTDDIVSPVWNEIMEDLKARIINAAQDRKHLTAMHVDMCKGLDIKTVYSKLKPDLEKLGYGVYMNDVLNCIYVDWEWPANE